MSAPPPDLERAWLRIDAAYAERDRLRALLAAYRGGFGRRLLRACGLARPEPLEDTARAAVVEIEEDLAALHREYADIVRNQPKR